MVILSQEAGLDSEEMQEVVEEMVSYCRR